MILIFINLFVAVAKALVNPQGPTIVSDYTNCVSRLIDSNFNDRGVLYFASTKNMSSSVSRIRAELLGYAHKDMKFLVQTGSPSEIDMNICENFNDDKLQTAERLIPIPVANYVIIIIDNPYDFSRIASRLIRARSWNPKALFIVVLFSFTNTERNLRYVENIARCLFRFFVVNIAVIVPQENNIRNAVIYSWKPYDPPLFCGYKNETAEKRMFIEDVCERGIPKLKKNLFYNKIPDNMMGCVLEMLAIERQPYVSSDPSDPNIEKNLIEQMVHDFNFTTNYSMEKTRGDKILKQWDGALRKLTTRKGNILIGGIFPDDEVNQDFECSATYLADSYTWVVPRAMQRSRWVAFIVIFQQLVWITCAASIAVCVLFWKFMGHASGDTLYHRSIGHCFMNALYSNLGFAAYARPIKDSLRVFFMFFTLYCILLTTAYSTKLIDVLTNPPFEYQIQTVEEMVASGMDFGGFEELQDLFFDSDDPLDHYIGEKWITVDNYDDAFIGVVVHRNFSVLCSRLKLQHISATLAELSDAAGNYKYFDFDSNVFTVPVEMVAMRGFPFLENFSRKLQLFKQIGLNDRAREKFRDDMLKQRALLLKKLKQSEYEVDPLSLEHLQGGFFALMLGWVCGAVVLVIEIVVDSDYLKFKLEKLRKHGKKLFKIKD